MASLHASAASTARSTGSALHRARLVQPGEEEQVLDERLHASRLLLDAAQDHGEVDAVAGGVEPEQLGEALDRGERGAQLVGGVGQELAQALLGGFALLERLLDLAEHGVEGEAELPHLRAGLGRGDALREVAGGDGAGGGGHLLERAQPPPQDEPGPEGEEGEEHGGGARFDVDQPP